MLLMKKRILDKQFLPVLYTQMLTLDLTSDSIVVPSYPLIPAFVVMTCHAVVSTRLTQPAIVMSNRNDSDHSEAAGCWRGLP